MKQEYTVTASLKLKPIISETKEVIQALTEFVNNLERIENKYSDKAESVKS